MDNHLSKNIALSYCCLLILGLWSVVNLGFGIVCMGQYWSDSVAQQHDSVVATECFDSLARSWAVLLFPVCLVLTLGTASIIIWGSCEWAISILSREENELLPLNVNHHKRVIPRHICFNIVVSTAMLIIAWVIATTVWGGICFSNDFPIQCNFELGINTAILAMFTTIWTIGFSIYRGCYS